MSPNPHLRLALDSGPLTVAVISPDPGLAFELRRAVRVRSDIVVVDGTRGADVLIWDTGADGDSEPLILDDVATLALADEKHHVEKALAAGAQSVISRSVGVSGLIAAIIATRYGLSVRTPALSSSAQRSPEGNQVPDLSEREREVLAGLGAGQTNADIAADLGITVHTVKYHVQRLLSKLQASTRTGAVLEALRQGLISLS